MRMKIYFLYISLFLLSSFDIYAKKVDRNKADSIILKVLENRDYYESFIDTYEAKIYIKGNSLVKKKNILYRFAPDFLYLDRKGNNTFVEAVVDVNFNSPNFFNSQIVAVNGTKKHIDDIRERVIHYLNMKIYNSTLFNEKIIFPGAKGAFKYYRFEYVSQTDTLNHLIHRIKVIPKVRSQQLISGFLDIVDGLWTISSLDINGKWEFTKFRVETEFGLPEKNFLLPLQSKITFNLNLLGNEIVNHYFSTFSYSHIRKYESETQPAEINYDLSDYFKTETDSIPIVTDEQFWTENRTIALTPYEKYLMDTNRDEPNKIDLSSDSIRNQQNLPKGIIASKRFRYNNTQMSYSGLLNPLKLAYSKLDGVVYWQQFRFRHYYASGQTLQLNPDIGFVFQREQVYFNVPVQWHFQPRRLGEISFNFRNKNQTYNATTIDMIDKEMPDSIDFNDLDLEYFHHLNLDFTGKYEIANGLLFKAGISYEWYIPIKYKNKETPLLRSGLGEEVDEDLADLVDDRYRVVTPMIGITWTPGQYYRFNGKQKEYIGSAFPTFSAECIWGVKGLLGSNSDFVQIETDMQQKIPVGLMSSFQYYIGAGKFVRTHSLYFADFNLFQKRNFPQSWDDPIGGVFHLLNGEWYSASRTYAQAHFMYEFPYTVFRLFRGITKDLLKERIYISQLYTPTLPSYTELGYGIGNFIGNAGVFVSFHRGEYKSIGAKFTFDLGK